MIIKTGEGKIIDVLKEDEITDESKTHEAMDAILTSNNIKNGNKEELIVDKSKSETN